MKVPTVALTGPHTCPNDSIRHRAWVHDGPGECRCACERCRHARKLAEMFRRDVELEAKARARFMETAARIYPPRARDTVIATPSDPRVDLDPDVLARLALARYDGGSGEKN